MSPFPTPTISGLRTRCPIAYFPCPSKRLQRLLHPQQNRGLDRTERASPTNGQRDRGHRDIVRRFPEVVSIVRAEGIPKPVQLPADRFDVGLGGLSTVLRIFDHPGPCLRRVAEFGQIK